MHKKTIVGETFVPYEDCSVKTCKLYTKTSDCFIGE